MDNAVETAHHGFVNTLNGYLVVFLGAGIGGMVRHSINRFALPFGWSFPFATLAVNVTGSIALGLIAGWFAFRGDSSQVLRLFLTTGLLGGYTTFSAFSLDAILLWQRGQVLQAIGYIAASVILSLVGVLIGMSVIRG